MLERCAGMGAAYGGSAESPMRTAFFARRIAGSASAGGMLSASRNIAISKISDLGGRIRDTFPAESRTNFQESGEERTVLLHRPGAVLRRYGEKRGVKFVRVLNDARIPVLHEFRFENGAQVRRSFRFPGKLGKPERRQFPAFGVDLHGDVQGGERMVPGLYERSLVHNGENSARRGETERFLQFFEKFFTRTAERCESVGIGNDRL